MTTTLVSFLGRKPNKGYQEAVYDFGAITKSTRFFGLALAEVCRPDRVVILGTKGSMWDILLEHLSDPANPNEDLLQLIDAAERHDVRQEQLDRIAPLVQEMIGCPCRLTIIPHGRDESEQMDILRLMAKDIPPSEQVILDLTHGLRHLPMLAFLSALYLEAAKRARISGIYYGAFDLTRDGVTPVLRLDGLLRTAHWIKALNTYDKDGDYSVFAPLLEQEELNGAFLSEAAFYERSTNPERARGKLTGFRADGMRDKPVAGLFAEPLKERIDWFRGQERADWEQSLARIYYEKRDYLRTVIYALEAFVTRKVAENGGDINNYDARAEVLQDANDVAVKEFKYLRNSMTHGVKSRDRGAMTTLRTEKELRAAIEGFFDSCLNASIVR